MSAILLHKQSELKKIQVQNSLVKNKILPIKQPNLKWEDLAGLSWIILDSEMIIDGI